MPKWHEERRDDVLQIVRDSRTMKEACERVAVLTGTFVSADALRNAFTRWRERWPQVPPLRDLLGAGLKGKAPPPELLEVNQTLRREQPSSHSKWFWPEVDDPDLLEIDDALDDEEIEFEDEEVELKVPKEARPPAPPEAHHVNGETLTTGYLFSDGDTHYPIQDPYVEAAKIALARDLRPKVWVNVGDLYDAWLLSRYDKEADRMFADGKARLQEEFDAAQPYLREVCSIADRFHLILGNHERRLSRLIGLNLGLFGLRSLEWKTMAELPENAQVHNYGARLRVGQVTFEHGDRVGGRFGIKHREAWMLDNRGDRNTVMGHSHKIGMRYATRWSVDGEPHVYMAIDQGHGSNVKEQTYEIDPNWQHGFCVVEYWTQAGKPRFTLHHVHVIGGEFMFGGKLYSGKKLM